jgi:hypothetical protein
VGFTGQRAPLGLRAFAGGPSVAWRKPSERSYYYGARAAYSLMPVAYQGLRLHRATVQGLVGAQAALKVPLFLEAGLGWGVLGVSTRDKTLGDPTVLTTHVAAGVTAKVAGLSFRLAATASSDRVTLSGDDRWDPSYGLELALRR